MGVLARGQIVKDRESYRLAPQQMGLEISQVGSPREEDTNCKLLKEVTFSHIMINQLTPQR